MADDASSSTPNPEDIMEIKGEDIFLKRGEGVVKQVKLSDLSKRIAQQEGLFIFPDGSPIPDGVRFIRNRGNATVLVIELQPQVRQVRWISSPSPEPYGASTLYDSVTLSFPYIIMVILFINGSLCGYQQLFYRKFPVSSEKDELYLPNLLNVSDGYGQRCWLCLQNIGDISRLSWNKKVEKIIEYLWEMGFNRSSEHHEGNSYWQKMQRAGIDPRISSVEDWERATKEEPLFMIKLDWMPAGLTIKEVSEFMLSKGYAASPIKTASDLIPLICRSSSGIRGAMQRLMQGFLKE